jgi:hypothetical protein
MLRQVSDNMPKIVENSFMPRHSTGEGLISHVQDHDYRNSGLPLLCRNSPRPQTPPTGETPGFSGRVSYLLAPSKY